MKGGEYISEQADEVDKSINFNTEDNPHSFSFSFTISFCCHTSACYCICPQMDFSTSAAAAAAAGNPKSAAAVLGPNQCAFCQLEGHQKL